MTKRGGTGPCDGAASGFRPAVRRRTFFSAIGFSYFFCFFVLLYFLNLYDAIVTDRYTEGDGFRHTERIKKLDAVLHALRGKPMTGDLRYGAPLDFSTATFPLCFPCFQLPLAFPSFCFKAFSIYTFPFPTFCCLPFQLLAFGFITGLAGFLILFGLPEGLNLFLILVDERGYKVPSCAGVILAVVAIAFKLFSPFYESLFA
jgi:hypothetical protein